MQPSRPLSSSTRAVAPRGGDAVEPATVPASGWMPEGRGKSCRPLRFLKDGAGWVELMRLEPGVRVELHRHSGEVHAYNLEGRRRLSNGQLVGPGDYVYEPPGNVDWWEAVGDRPLVVFVVVKGSVEYLGPGNTVTRVVSTASRVADYRHWCAETGTEALDLGPVDTTETRCVVTRNGAS